MVILSNTLKIGNGVVEIGDRAFNDCDNLYEVYIPASVETYR